jgi:hypothetical protein
MSLALQKRKPHMKFSPSADNPSLIEEPFSQDHIFNDDLLINDGDLEHAKFQFSEIFHVLDHPELRLVFLRYEEMANKARIRVRGMGLLAVLCGTVALLSTATESLWHHWSLAWLVGMVFELAFFVAALIAVGGLWLGPWKKRWLECRLMTERLRQWHFQLLARRSSEVEASCDQTNPNSVALFQAQRAKWFNDFIHGYRGKLDSQLVSFTSDLDYAEDWLHPLNANSNANSAVLGRIFEAYRRLRFMHQCDFANHKMTESKDRKLWQFLKWPLLRQQAMIRALVASCFVLALLCSAAVIVNRVFEIKLTYDNYFGSAAIVIAIIGVALRTLQDGLGVTKDIERYRDYRGKVSRLLLWFDATTDGKTRLKLMEEMELAVVDEMKDFLRTHQDAAFVL